MMHIERIPWASYPTASCPKSCWYLDADHICNYYLRTGIRRPCPAGKGCTVAETGRKRRGASGAVRQGTKPMTWDAVRGLELRKQGLSYSQIADALGATEDKIRAYGRKHGWPDAEPPQRLRWDTDKARGLREQGASYRQIAAACGVSITTVGAYAARSWADLRPAAASWDKEKARALWEQGATDAEIAREVGAAQKTVAAYRREHWGEAGLSDYRAAKWDVDKARELYAAGWTLEAIAQACGATKSAVSNYARRHWPRRGGENVKKPKWDEHRGFGMYLNGASDQEIADALGIRADAVGSYRRRHWAAFQRNGEEGAPAAEVPGRRSPQRRQRGLPRPLRSLAMTRRGRNRAAGTR